MKFQFVALLIFAFAFQAFSQPAVLRNAAALEEQGKFTEAAQVLQDHLATYRGTLSGDQEKEILFAMDRLDRIRKDYSLTKAELFKSLKESIEGLTEEEFESWVRAGWFDSRVIDGQLYFVYTSRSNLFFRHPELEARRRPHKDTSKFDQAVWQSYLRIKELGAKSMDRLVGPRRFKATMTVTVKANAVPPGETLRCWLPYPRIYPHQTDVELLASSSPVVWMAEPLSPIRSVFLEQKAERDKPTVFRIEYLYTTYAVNNIVEPPRAVPYDPKQDPEVACYIAERPPHVVFTEEIKQLSKKILEGETNPYLKVKRLYDWIAENILYSYAREYSTIANLGEYCLKQGYGDCGQEALLFITLCRWNGIPARWQSGWLTMPGGKTLHDWTEVYIKPYGWIPVDPYMGLWAVRYATTLTPEQRAALKEFYCGGLDGYRMIANADHSMELFPSKRSLRSDNVDFQRGELEYGTTNIYFDRYDYELSVEEVNP